MDWGEMSGKKSANLTMTPRAGVRARAKKPESELTDLQKLFCLKYVEQGCCNAAGALEAAGSRAKYNSRCSKASGWLRKDKIVAEIKRLNSKADKAVQNRENHVLATVAKRKARLSEIALAESGSLRGLSLENGQLVVDDALVKSALNARAQIIMVSDPNHDGKGPAQKIPAMMVDVQLHNPIDAIKELNKMDGVYKETNLQPAEIHIHMDKKLEHDEQTAAQLNDPNLRVPILGSAADQKRYRRPAAGGGNLKPETGNLKDDPFKAVTGKNGTN